MNTLYSNARERRTTVDYTVRYRYSDPEETGTARLLNVGRVGAALRLGRYLRPGRQLWLSFASPLVPGKTVEIRAQVIWCRPVSTVEFLAGLYVLRENPESALAFGALGYGSEESDLAPNRETARGVKDLWWSSAPAAETDDVYKPAAGAKAV